MIETLSPLRNRTEFHVQQPQIGEYSRRRDHSEGIVRDNFEGKKLNAKNHKQNKKIYDIKIQLYVSKEGCCETKKILL